MKKAIYVLAMLTAFSCTTDENDLNNLNQMEVKDSSLTQKTSNREIDNLAKNIVQVLAKINLNEEIIEGNIDRFNEDLQKGAIFKNDYISPEEMGEAFEKYYAIKKDATVELFTLIYENRNLISDSDPSGKLLNEAIMQEAEIYNAQSTSQNKLIFSALVAAINPKGCGYAVVAGVVDTALSAVVTATTAPTGIGAVAGAASTAASYTATIAAAVRCKK